MFEIRINQADINRLERLLKDIPRAMPRVMSRGLNRTASFAYTRLGRMLAKKTGLKVGSAKAFLRYKKATYQNWYARIDSISWECIPLYWLKPYPKKPMKGEQWYKARKLKGVKYKDPMKGGRFLLRHAFVQQMSSGHIGVFKRYGKRIFEEFSPTVPEIILSNKSEFNSIYKESLSRLEKNIHDQVGLILRKRAG